MSVQNVCVCVNATQRQKFERIYRSVSSICFQMNAIKIRFHLMSAKSETVSREIFRIFFSFFLSIESKPKSNSGSSSASQKEKTRTKGEKIDEVQKKSRDRAREKDRKGDQLTYRCLHCETWLMILHVPMFHIKKSTQQQSVVSITNLLISFIPWNLHRKCAYFPPSS